MYRSALTYGYTAVLRLYHAALFLVVISCCCGCGKSEVPESVRCSDELRAVGNYIAEGRNDSVIAACSPLYRTAVAQNDTAGVLYAGAVMAQAYLFMDELDSLRSVLAALEPYEKAMSMPEVATILVNVKGLLAIKEGLNYQVALKYYRKGLEYVSQTNSTGNRISLLTNIVNIYYLMSDSHGLEYARQAYDLSVTPGASPFSCCIAETAMAQMLFLASNCTDALSHIRRAYELAGEHGFRQLLTGICLVEADIMSGLGRDSLAEEYYGRALDAAKYAELSVSALLYLRYGIFKQKAGDFDGALEMYQQGLVSSYASGSMEFRKELLEHISGIYASTDNLDKAVLNYMRYSSYMDSIPTVRNAQEFHSLMLRFQQQEYELSKADAERKMTVIIAVVVVLAVLLLSGALLFFKQNRMYRILVRKHQDYLDRLSANDAIQEQMSVSAGAPCADKDFELFARIDSLMKNDRIFRENDLSLDKLSSYVDSNRNYVSRAINKYSGLSFHNYLNMYRINEAIRILSSSKDGEVLFKSLAADIGYNSLSVFSKAFVKETGVAPTIYKKELEKGKLFDKSSK